jgi:hypothetical protein
VCNFFISCKFHEVAPTLSSGILVILHVLRYSVNTVVCHSYFSAVIIEERTLVLWLGGTARVFVSYPFLFPGLLIRFSG